MAASVAADVAARGGSIKLIGRLHTCTTLERDVELRHHVLGSGVNGEVHLAARRAGGPLCAVKCLKTAGVDATDLALLRNELESCLTMDHPHVVRLETAYETKNGDVHLVMEQLEGEEVLDRLMSRSRFSEGDAARAVMQMLSAVAYMHGHGLVHRDLKLENFLFESEDGDHLKLIDFGFARRWEQHTCAGSRCQHEHMTDLSGSRNYLAPEVIAGDYTEKADVWSVGIMAYTLLCGGFPWAAGDDGVWEEIRAGKPHYHPELFLVLSEEAQRFVQSLLTLNPVDRPSVEAALGDPWLRLHTGAAAELSLTTVESFRGFARTTSLQRAARLVAAWLLPASSQAMLREQFRAVGCNSVGAIHCAGFREALSKVDVGCAEADKLFAAIDANGEGEIAYSEFVAASMDSAQLAGETLRLTFARFDANADGLITEHDLRAILGNRGFESTSCADLLRSVGHSDRGICFAEFSALLLGPGDPPAKPHAKCSRSCKLRRQSRLLTSLTWCCAAEARA